MLKDKYLRLSHDMCFKYDTPALGSFVQVREAFGLNSVLTSKIDVSKLEAGAVLQVTYYKNTFLSKSNSPELAFSLIFDRTESDQSVSASIGSDAATLAKNFVVILEIAGGGKTEQIQGMIENVNKSEIQIHIDFRKSSKLKITVDSETLIDLDKNLPPGEKKEKILEIIGKNTQTPSSDQQFDSIFENDSNYTNALFAYSLYSKRGPAQNSNLSTVKINQLKIND